VGLVGMYFGIEINLGKRKDGKDTGKVRN